MCGDREMGGGGGVRPTGEGDWGRWGGGGDQLNICINIIIRAERFEIHV